eukprot:348414-Amphidinium_carterae.1
MELRSGHLAACLVQGLKDFRTQVQAHAADYERAETHEAVRKELESALVLKQYHSSCACTSIVATSLSSSQTMVAQSANNPLCATFDNICNAHGTGTEGGTKPTLARQQIQQRTCSEQHSG